MSSSKDPGSNSFEKTEELTHRSYIRWDDPGVESIPPGEDEDIKAVADLINEGQKAQFNLHRHCYTGTHARTQGIVNGTLVVPDDLPKHLKQSMFSQGGEYPVICRYSSEPPDPGLDDRIPQPRGFAMKVFDIPSSFGPRFPTGADLATQDIEFNSTPALDLADAKTTREIIGLRLAHSGDGTLQKHLEARPDCSLQTARDKVYNTHLESVTQYSQTAYRFGEYVAKYRLIPNTETQRDLHSEAVAAANSSSAKDSDVLQRWLSSFHASHDASYLLQFQLLENLDEQPVEYAGTVWPADRYPFQAVAELRIPKQQSWDYARKAFWEDRMRVDPWLGLQSLQPLGSSNRLRRVVYPASSRLRREMNATTELQIQRPEEVPGGVEGRTGVRNEGLMNG